MHAGEIEDEICKLAEAPFDAAAFPYQFLQAFGVSDAAVAKLKAGRDNKSDVPGAVLQRARNNIHLKVCPPGEVAATLTALRDSDATKKLKAKYVLATDGEIIAAERLRDGAPLACPYKDLPNHFGILLELAGISTTPPIDESTFDIRATNKLNKLYVELRRHNPEWDTDARRQDLNHFFARLIFCFFAEDTGIFDGIRLFTGTLEKYTDRTGSNVHEILAELFRAMDIRKEDRANSDLRPYALKFEYVNGNLFTNTTGTFEAPHFNQAARIHLLAIGNLNWKLVNPDIFGSMIQAVADDEERGEIGMHYTSVPNILKVLNPLFLDDLRQKLTEAGDGATPTSKGQLTRLRDRLSKIRVFDPACGSGNFLVIAYKEMRKIEAEINARRGEAYAASFIPMTNFRGIELRGFAAEIARLALIIAKFQCDSLHIGDLYARTQILPLDKDNWITCDNALRVDWHEVMKDKIDSTQRASERLFDEHVPLTQRPIDFENAGGETYICGNPPYAGATVTAPKGASQAVKERLRKESERRKSDLQTVLSDSLDGWKSLDYVSGWFVKAVNYAEATEADAAFVSTNSICQGQQVPVLWPFIFRKGYVIAFAHTSFKWSNLAANKAGVTVAIIGLSKRHRGVRRLYSIADDGSTAEKSVENINAYLVAYPDVIVEKRSKPLSALSPIEAGGKPVEGGHLFLSMSERQDLLRVAPTAARYIKRTYGADEYTNGKIRYCLWVTDVEVADAQRIQPLAARFESVRQMRLESSKSDTNDGAKWPHRFQ